MSASPSVDKLATLLVATTKFAQTTLAATPVIGPAVLFTLGNTSPRISTRNRPSSVSTAIPRRTTHGAPPLGTPAITAFGIDPTTGERNTNSSADVPIANIPAITHTATTNRLALFM